MNKLIVLCFFLLSSSSYASLDQFDISLTGSFTGSGTVSTVNDYVDGTQTAVTVHPFSLSIDIENSRQGMFDVICADESSVLHNHQGTTWYLHNGTYVLLNLPNETPYCYFINQTFSNQIQNYKGHRLLRWVYDLSHGKVDQYKGIVLDNAFCEGLSFSEIAVKQSNKHWVTWQTQTGIKIRGKLVKTTAAYEFTSFTPRLPESALFKLDPLCWRPSKTDFCSNFIPQFGEWNPYRLSSPHDEDVVIETDYSE